MSTDYPGSPVSPIPAPGSAPAPRKTNWWLIGGIVAALILCACIVCFASPMIMAAVAPSMMPQLYGTMCTIQYPDLTSEQCNSWAQDAWKNHQSDLLDCSNSGQTSAGSTDPNALFKCLDDKGIGPKSK